MSRMTTEESANSPVDFQQLREEWGAAGLLDDMDSIIDIFL